MDKCAICDADCEENGTGWIEVSSWYADVESETFAFCGDHYPVFMRLVKRIKSVIDVANAG